MKVNDEGGLDLDPEEYLSLATYLAARKVKSDWLEWEDVPNLSEKCFENLAACVDDVAEEMFRMAHGRANAKNLDVQLIEEAATDSRGPAASVEAADADRGQSGRTDAP